ncbi:MAG: PAS domain S-box protein [Nitrospinales bacterium]
MKFKESKALIDLLVDHLPVLVAYVDSEQRYRFNNKKYEEWFGVPREEIYGQHIRDFLGEPTYKAIQKNVEAALSGKKVHREFFSPYKRGGGRYIHMSFVPHRAGDGKVVGFFVTVEDITTRKRNEAELEKYRHHLEAMIKEHTAKFLNSQTALRHEIAIRKRTEQSLHKKELTLRSIVENMRDALIMIDDTAAIQMFNPGAEQIFGYSAAEVMGKNVDILIPESHKSRHEVGFKNYAKSGKRTIEVWRSIEVPGKKKDGTIVPMELSISEMELDKKKYFIGTFRDITSRKQVEEKLQRYSLELERSNQALNDFAAIASHDLQEPLRKVTLFSDRLKEKYADALGDSGKDYIERMQRAVERMRCFIEDLLNYSRITTRAQPFKPVDLGKITREALVDLKLRVTESGGRVDIHQLPILEADKLQMCQLFQNLIGNALKFHREGAPPEISVNSRRLNNGFWEITVEDNGIGFDPKDVERIFKPFERLHGRSAYEGSGMGLSICQKIAKRHGGAITAKSVPQQGTTMIVTLPEKHS